MKKLEEQHKQIDEIEMSTRRVFEEKVKKCTRCIGKDEHDESLLNLKTNYCFDFQQIYIESFQNVTKILPVKLQTEGKIF